MLFRGIMNDKNYKKYIKELLYLGINPIKLYDFENLVRQSFTTKKEARPPRETYTRDYILPNTQNSIIIEKDYGIPFYNMSLLENNNLLIKINTNINLNLNEILINPIIITKLQLKEINKNSGVYSISVNGVGAKQASQDPSFFKDELLDRTRSLMFRSASAFKKVASIVDNRSKLY